MADELYNELIAKGFLPELKFRNDNYTKLLYVKNIGQDATRVSKLGNLNVPLIELVEQNKTLKAVTGGTRVHLAPASEVPVGPWPCIGNSTITARFYDDTNLIDSRDFEVTISDGTNVRSFMISGVGYISDLMLNDPIMGPYLIDEDFVVNADSEGEFSFTNMNGNVGYQIEIKQLTGNLEIGIYEWDDNTSVHLVNPSTVRFCVTPKPSFISCANAIDHIRLTLSWFWEWGTTLTVTVNETTRSWTYGEEYPSFTDWFNLNYSGIVQVTSGDDYRFENLLSTDTRITISTDRLEFAEPIQPSPPYNITYEVSGNTIRFCLKAGYVISCADATDFIHYQLNHGNLEDIVVDNISYGNDITVFNTDPVLSTIFNADYDSYGILYNVSQDPHRILFIGYDLNLQQKVTSSNETIVYFDDGSVGFCLGPQPPQGLQPLTFSLQTNPVLKPYWEDAEIFNGQYFISGYADQYNYNPVLRRSLDGVDWIDVVLPGNVPIYGLVAGPDKIIAYCSRGGGYWSSNGIDWYNCTFNISRDVYDGIYVDGQYILVGEYASMFTSTDGINFTAILDGTNLSTHPVFGGGVSSFSSITYGNGKYIVSGRHGTPSQPQSKNAFFATSNLTSWTVWQESVTYPNNNRYEPNHRDITFDGTQFVAIGAGTIGVSDVPVFYGVTYTSVDGVSWTRAESTTDYPSRIIWVEDAYITSDFVNGIKTSTDLLNWTPIYTRAQLSARAMGGLVYKNNTLLSAGFQNQIIIGTRG